MSSTEAYEPILVLAGSFNGWSVGLIQRKVFRPRPSGLLRQAATATVWFSPSTNPTRLHTANFSRFKITGLVWLW